MAEWCQRRRSWTSPSTSGASCIERGSVAEHSTSVPFASSSFAWRVSLTVTKPSWYVFTFLRICSAHCVPEYGLRWSPCHVSDGAASKS